MKTIKLVLIFIFLFMEYNYAQEKWSRFTKDDRLASIWIQAILEDTQGNILLIFLYALCFPFFCERNELGLGINKNG